MKPRSTVRIALLLILSISLWACASSGNGRTKRSHSHAVNPGGSAGDKTPQVSTQGSSSKKIGSLTMTTSLSNRNVLLSGPGIVHMAIDLKGAAANSDKRLPMNVALVIDRSGSMRGEKIEDARASARHFVMQLSPQDRIAIISYSDGVRVDLPSSKATAATQKSAMEAIAGIQAGGSTNLSGGLFRAQDEVERHMAAGQVNRVILMSDGLANRGLTDTKAISKRAQQTSQRGVTTTTMGVGTDYNEDLMTSLADHAGGNYYFIQESKQIAHVFKEELRKMFATVAQNTVVTFTLEDGIDLKELYGYTFTRQNGQVTVALSDIFGGQKRSILLALEVPCMRSGKLALSQVSLQFDDVNAGLKPQNTQVSVGVTVTKDAALVESTRNRGVEERVGEVQVAQAVEKAADLVKSGNYQAAKRVLQRQRTNTASRAKGMGGSARLQKQIGVLDQLEVEFEAAEAAPASAPARASVKKAKAKARKLQR